MDCRLWGCTDSDTTEATQQQQQRVLAVVNGAAMNIGVHVSFLNSSFVPLYAQQWDCWFIW